MNDAASAEAMGLHRSGRLVEAAALYRTILGLDPDHADSLHLLGLITAEQGDRPAGIALIRRAMAIDPNRAVHHNSLGQVYRRSGLQEDARRAFSTAAALRPDAAEIHNNLATALLDLGQRQDAIAHYRRALALAPALAPALADIWYNLANALADTGASAETETCYRKAIALKPDFAAALGNYGRWLMTLGRWAEAEPLLARAVGIAPANATGWNNLGVALCELGRGELGRGELSRGELGRGDAEGCYRAAMDLDPTMGDAHYNLGRLRFDQGRWDEAVACHEAAIAADPGFGAARIAACMAGLPIVYRNEQAVAESRSRYAKALEALVAGDTRSLAAAIGTAQPFFLPYQGEDDRTLQATYGAFACRVLAEAEPPTVLAARPAPGERIRIGIVSGFFCDHTLLKLFLEGWLAQLDRGRFEVMGFHTGFVTDAQTARCAGLCDRFVHGLGSSAAWRAAVSAAEPHVLLYPEVGMDAIAGRLAAMRLAPVQCVAWGQPETTGMPTVDYFLSSEMMEPPDGDSHYTERLVRLPHLGLCYTPDESAGSESGIPGRVRAPVFWSGQPLYKYLPRYDAIFPRIAAELGACRFVFIAFAKSQAVTDVFRNRLWRAFEAAGLDAGRHVVILPPMSQADYIDAVGLADVILDTPGWSGGKSTLDCLAVDPAIVTLPGRFMRGRHTAAILRRIGCEATIAGSVDEYVSIAVRLARDPHWRAEVRQAVAVGKRRAFDDHAYVRALERFLIEAVAKHA
jgi:predicted O-linked N-acetylglucosamine transferase (SPINDLY family)